MPPALPIWSGFPLGHSPWQGLWEEQKGRGLLEAKNGETVKSL